MLHILPPAFCMRRMDIVSNEKCLDCFLGSSQLRWLFRLRHECVMAHLVAPRRNPVVQDPVRLPVLRKPLPKAEFPSFCTRRMEAVDEETCLDCSAGDNQPRWMFPLREGCAEVNLIPLQETDQVLGSGDWEEVMADAAA